MRGLCRGVASRRLLVRWEHIAPALGLWPVPAHTWPVPEWTWAIVGLVVGAVAAGLAARWQIRRSLAKVRAAERRARGAERLAEIGAMTGGLAHEIKNPLSTIGLNAQLLAEGLDELEGDPEA